MICDVATGGNGGTGGAEGPTDAQTGCSFSDYWDFVVDGMKENFNSNILLDLVANLGGGFMTSAISKMVEIAKQASKGTLLTAETILGLFPSGVVSGIMGERADRPHRKVSS